MTPFSAAVHTGVAGCIFASAAVGGAWQCPDNGSSTTIATNTGTGNESYEFSTGNRVGDDTSLQIEVFVPGEGDKPDVVISAIELVPGTDPTITLGPGHAVRIVDPADADTDSGSGSYKKV